MTAQEALKQASELFHQIVGSYTARRILESTPGKTRAAIKLRADLEEKLLTDEQIDKLAMDGFEICVRGLIALGDPSASIHECSPTEEPE